MQRALDVPRRSPVLALLAGLAAAVWLGSGGRPRAGEPLAWVADAEADRVVLLDEELAPLAEIPVRRPCGLVPAKGGVLVLRREGTGRARATELLWLAEDGSVAARGACGALLDAEAGPGDELFLLERTTGGARVLALGGPGGTRRCLIELAAARRLAAGEAGLLVAAPHELVRIDAGLRPAVVARRSSAAEVLDVAAVAGGFWVLEQSGGEASARLVDAALATRELRPAGRSARLCADGVRCLALAEGRARELPAGTESPLPPSLVDAALVERGLLAASLGAVLALDEHGSVRELQGGFRALAALAPVRR